MNIKKTSFFTPTIQNRIDFETMVIADPVTTISTAAADADIVQETYTLGDCLTDTLSGKFTTHKVMLKLMISLISIYWEDGSLESIKLIEELTE